MSWSEWVNHDAIGLADKVRRGEVTSAEIAKQAREAILRTDNAISAVVEVFEDVVVDPFKDGMQSDGVFAGVPYLMKDSGPMLKGRLQEFGSKMMLGHRTTEDAFLTKKLRQAGLNIIGRSTTPEFSVCSSCENDLFVTRNPWDLEYTTCGSSAGAAAVVAAGVMPIAHATDGGGSIRIPAGFNGNIGLKVSRGVFSLAPGRSDLNALVVIQGCHSRTIRDTAAFVDNCRGGAPGEFMPFWEPQKPYAELIKSDPPRLKIALSHEWGDFRATPHLVSELERAGRFLEALGHNVEWALPDVDFQNAFSAQTTCYISNFSQVISDQLRRLNLKHPPKDLLEPVNIKIWEEGLKTTYSDRARMQNVFNVTSRAFGHFYQDWDIILTPITALPTPKLGTTEYLTTSEAGVYDWFANLWKNFAYTPLSNLCGTPAISLPMAVQESGLPFGIQAQAAIGNDGLLLQLGAQIERALDGKWNDGRRPRVHVTNDGK